jgi:hypothetical protein
VVSLRIFSEANDGTMCSGVDSASKNEYQDTPGSKAGRCVRLTTYHLLVPNVKKIRGLNLLDPHGPVQACSGTALLLVAAATIIVKVIFQSAVSKMSDPIKILI